MTAVMAEKHCYTKEGKLNACNNKENTRCVFEYLCVCTTGGYLQSNKKIKSHVIIIAGNLLEMWEIKKPQRRL